MARTRDGRSDGFRLDRRLRGGESYILHLPKQCLDLHTTDNGAGREGDRKTHETLHSSRVGNSGYNENNQIMTVPVAVLQPYWPMFLPIG